MKNIFTKRDIVFFVVILFFVRLLKPLSLSADGPGLAIIVLLLHLLALIYIFSRCIKHISHREKVGIKRFCKDMVEVTQLHVVMDVLTTVVLAFCGVEKYIVEFRTFIVIMITSTIDGVSITLIVYAFLYLRGKLTGKGMIKKVIDNTTCTMQ